MVLIAFIILITGMPAHAQIAAPEVSCEVELEKLQARYEMAWGMLQGCQSRTVMHCDEDRQQCYTVDSTGEVYCESVDCKPGLLPEPTMAASLATGVAWLVFLVRKRRDMRHA